MKQDVIIVGGGIVGLATAHALLRRNPQWRVLLLEKEEDVAAHQSGHNSGVIHSGIYYRPGSLKAENCRRGYALLLSFCREQGVPFEICGKLILATEERELPFLETLHERGIRNGLAGLRRIGREEIRDHEPHAAGIGGIFVPQTGIVDFRAVCRRLAAIVAERGGVVRCGERVASLEETADEVVVRTDRGECRSRLLVNCAGLMSDRLARMSRPDLDVRIVPFRGEYYTLRPERRALIRNLIYPVPDPAFPFLGVHFTRMINGGVEAGPNAVLALKREGYRKHDLSWRDLAETVCWPGFRKIARRYWSVGLGEIHRSLCKKAFVRALQRLVPEVGEDDLVPGGAGVRAQACSRDGRLLDDFYFVTGRRVLHVCNAPSPAATASLAIGDSLAERLGSALA